MRKMWRIRADMRNQRFELPDWVGKTSYWLPFRARSGLEPAVLWMVN